MKTYRVTRTLDLGVLGERDCQIDFHYRQGHPGSWYRRNGDPGDPPEPDEVEVVGVHIDGVSNFDFVARHLEENDSFLEAAAEVYYGEAA